MITQQNYLEPAFQAHIEVIGPHSYCTKRNQIVYGMNNFPVAKFIVQIILFSVRIEPEKPFRVLFIFFQNAHFWFVSEKRNTFLSIWWLMQKTGFVLWRPNSHQILFCFQFVSFCGHMTVVYCLPRVNTAKNGHISSLTYYFCVLRLCRFLYARLSCAINSGQLTPVRGSLERKPLSHTS